MKLKRGIVTIASLGILLLTACNLLPGRLGETNDNEQINLFGNTNEAGSDEAVTVEESESGFLKVLHDDSHIYLVDDDGNMDTIFTCEGKYLIDRVKYDEDDIYYIIYDSESSYTGSKQLYHITSNKGCEYVDSVCDCTFIELYNDVLYSYQIDYDDNYDQVIHYIAYKHGENLGFDAYEYTDSLIIECMEREYGSLRGMSSIDCLNRYGVYYYVDPYQTAILGYDKDGNLINTIPVEDEYVSDLLFDGNNLVYRHNDYYNDIDECFYVDLKSGNKEKILEDVEVGYYVEFIDNKLIYILNNSDADVYDDEDCNELYVYDVASGELLKLATDKNISGASTYYYTNSYDSTIYCYNDIVYYVITSEKGKEWNLYNINTKESKNLGVMAYENNITKYGRVYSKSDRTANDKGRDIYVYSIEGYEITADIPGKDKINDFLSSLYEGWCKEADRGEDILSVYDEETFGEYYQESTEYYLAGVEKIGSHYLFVDFGGYDYYGGAHGYPMSEGYLFDMNTGEQIGLRDLCTYYSENDWKTVVATESMLLFDENPDAFFSYEDEDELYTEFYNNASFDMEVKYTQDGVIVEYPPYQFGPYSSGYINVKISYDYAGISLD